ncbi:pyridoxamine 5'-phosphate oxidase family protein [Micromonospora sp. FIMYZ51]|uniref:pyridoxamine 5'-phosphate oxidase family protein n=1 Tax=Micromonospora sp. FIMYZ51 TaxID=3051832 RepID=UPI00311FB5A8
MDDEAMTVAAGRQRVTELIRAARVCTLTTIALDGRLSGRPMLLPQTEYDGELWFLAHAGSSTVRQLRVNPEVEISFGVPVQRRWMSLTGTARDSYQPERAEQLWQPELAPWFPDGPDAAGLTLIAVHITDARHWTW